MGPIETTNNMHNTHDPRTMYGDERRYIVMRPLNLDNNVTIPVGTIIRGPINPYWFEDDIVKVYDGPGKALSLDDIVMTDSDYDIKIEDDNDVIKKTIPKCDCEKCNKCCKNFNPCKCCRCLPNDSNVIIFDTGEPSRVTLEEMALFETLKESNCFKKRSNVKVLDLKKIER